MRIHANPCLLQGQVGEKLAFSTARGQNHGWLRHGLYLTGLLTDQRDSRGLCLPVNISATPGGSSLPYIDAASRSQKALSTHGNDIRRRSKDLFGLAMGTLPSST